jgi:hypothetical protein
MKKILKVTLPSIFLLVFGISIMFVVSSCEEEPGTKCATCIDSTQCNSGLSCYKFSDGISRCVTKTGDLCSKF